MLNKDGQEQFKITMLGEFTLQSPLLKVTDQMNYSRKLWAVLAFFILYRNVEMSNDDTVKLLWEKGESLNPINTLKTQVSRVREMLSPLAPEGQQLILTGKNCYYWNPEIPLAVDVEEFECLFSAAIKRKNKREEDIRNLEKAVALYRGEFLPRIQIPWIDQKRKEYTENYMTAVLALNDVYEQQGRFEDVVDITSKALLEDPLNEDLNIAYLRSLIHIGKQQEARIHYEELNERFIKELDEYPNQALQELYSDIMQLQQQIETDLTSIQQRLRRLDLNQGAFVCDYGIFREAYFLEVRRSERSDERIFLGLITVSPNKKISSDVETKRLATVMRQLLTVLKNNLRRGDVISQYSKSQFVLLLPTQTYENGIMVLNRILSLFYKRNRKNDVILHCNLQQIKSKGTD